MKHHEIEGQLAAHKQEIRLALSQALVSITAILTTAVLFLVILGVGIGLGYVLHLAAMLPWVPGWVIAVGSFVEGAIFVIDVLCLLWSVGVHGWHFFKELWANARGK